MKVSQSQRRPGAANRPIDAYIIGAGGQARETFYLIDRTPALRFRGFLVEDTYSEWWGRIITGGKILGPPRLFHDRDGVYYVGIGDNAARDRIITTLGEERLGPPLIAPGVNVHTSNELAKGTLICGGATLTVDAWLGVGVLVNCHVSIAHDVRIGRCSTCSPGANISGNVTIGERGWIGTGATIIEKLTISDGVLIGAGAVVVRDLIECGTYLGVPARIRR